MKHKPDAITEGDSIIKLHSQYGLTETQAARAALVTAYYSQRNNDSLRQRTLNYLRCLVLGDEAANRIHDLEADWRKESNKLFYGSNSSNERKVIELKIEQIKKEIELILK